MAEVEAELPILKKFKSYLIRKLLELNRWLEGEGRGGGSSSKLEPRQGPKPELEVNEEADAADSRSQSDKCIRIENRDFPSHQIYRGLWRFSCPIARSGPHLLLLAPSSLPFPPPPLAMADKSPRIHPRCSHIKWEEKPREMNQTSQTFQLFLTSPPPHPPAPCRPRVVIAAEGEGEGASWQPATTHPISVHLNGDVTFIRGWFIARINISEKCSGN